MEGPTDNNVSQAAGGDTGKPGVFHPSTDAPPAPAQPGDDMHRGWIKLWRCLEDHEVARDPNALTVFVHLLFAARRHPKFNRRIGLTVERGQCDLTQEQIAGKAGLTRRAARDALERLKRYESITVANVKGQGRGRKHSIITIVNYETYQSSGPEPGPEQQKTEPEERPVLKKVEKGKNEKPPPPAWARELANDIAKNKADRFSQATTPKQVEDWAHKLDLLTRSKSFTTPPTPEIVAEVIRWGIEDDGDGEKWVGWGQQIRSAPSADKFTNIRASKDRARQQPREHGWYD